MADYLIPIGYAVFLWWFSTGLILLLNRLPKATFPVSFCGGFVLFAAAMIGLGVTRDDVSVSGAFCAFSCGLIAWAWQELTFYLGKLTGPRTHPCPDGCSGWKHFGHALQVSAYHELSIFMTLLAIVAIGWGAPNQLGLWTFCLLMVMHQSARLNVFLGVRNVTAEWVPDHLPFLRSFLNDSRPINAFWPISVIGAGLVQAWLIAAVLDSAVGSYQFTALLLLSALLGLAILEHVFLVLPLPLAALWRWWDRDRQHLRFGRRKDPSAPVIEYPSRVEKFHPQPGQHGLSGPVMATAPGRQQ